MKFVLVYPQGRLGNLLFQLVAACEVAADDGYIINLASEAPDYFDWDGKLITLPCPKQWRTFVNRIWLRLLRLLSKSGLIGLVKPIKLTVSNGYESEDIELKTKEGFMPGIIILQGFFHHDKFKKTQPRIKRNIINTTEKRLQGIAVESRVGVHFRFGDYEMWSVYGVKGAELPLSYYLNAFNLIDQDIKDPCYIIVSDDIQKAKSLMHEAGRQHVVFEGETAMEDFSCLASCSHAVLSASSFSWWAAKLISNPQKLVIAPEFWLGFKSDYWYPTQIKTDGFTYVSAR